MSQRRHAAPNRLRVFGLAVIASATLVLPAAPAAAADPITVTTRVNPDPGPVRLGFLPYWEVGSTSGADLVGLTHLAYHSIEARANGTLARGTNADDIMGGSAFAALRGAARAGGAKVLLNVARFGWSDVDRAETLTLLGDPAAHATLGAELAALVATGQFDGIVLDLEPVPAGGAAGHLALVRTLRAALGPDRPIVVALTSNPATAYVADLVGPGGADYVDVMTYDYRTGRAASAGPIAPLEGSFSVRSTIDAYKAVAPASRLLLGVPYYGRAWSVESTEIGAATIPASDTVPPSTSASYDTAHGLAVEYGFERDPASGTAVVNYTRSACAGCPLVQRQLWFDDPVSIAAKFRFALAEGLGGVGIWAIGYDDTATYALRDTLVTELIPDRTPPGLSSFTATTPFSPNGDGRRDRSRIQATGTAAVAWAVTVINASGKRVRAWSGTGRTVDMSWNGRNAGGTRVPDGAYRIRVRFADRAGNTLTATRSVRIDTGLPSLVVAVGDLASGMRVRWRSNERVTVVITVRDRNGRIVWRSAPSVGQSGAAVAPVRPGRYRVTVTATDEAGNRRGRVIDATIT
jgi:hypothetical protein